MSSSSAPLSIATANTSSVALQKTLLVSSAATTPIPHATASIFFFYVAVFVFLQVLYNYNIHIHWNYMKKECLIIIIEVVQHSLIIST